MTKLMIVETAPGSSADVVHARTLARGTVIVVDDDREQARSLAVRLRQDGFDVTISAGGAHALATIGGDPPDVVVVDLVAVEGLDFVRVLHARFPETGIIVTSSGRTRSLAEAEDGALAHLMKPFQPDEVVSVIDAELQVRSERQRGFGAMVWADMR